MAHTKAGGAAKRTVDVVGKRLGVKKFGGEFVRPGNIIIRQHGSHFHPGLNTMFGKDYTIFSKAEGYVNFRQMTGHKRGQKYVDVVPVVGEAKTEKKVVEIAAPAAEASAKPKKAPAKKAVAKK